MALSQTKKLFISYRSSDAAKVDKITRDLALLRYDDGTPRYAPWQDKHNLPPASPNWWDAIVDAIADCDMFVCNLSRASLQSEVCRAELDYAHKRNRPIVPLVLDGEFFLNSTSGKYDLPKETWALVPDWLAEQQFLFEVGTEFYGKFQEAVALYERNPPRDIPALRPLNPDSKAIISTNHALYDAACDYANRLAFADAQKHFYTLVRRNDPDYADMAAQWLKLIQLYTELIEMVKHRSPVVLFDEKWATYKNLFPKVFLDGIFDPKGFAIQPTRSGAAIPTFAPVSPPDAEAGHTAECAKVYTELQHEATTAQSHARKAELRAALAHFAANCPDHGDPAELAKRLALPAPVPSREQERLLAIMHDPTRSPTERAQAGNEINQYGDPRPGVIDFNFGADYWCKVPAGIFSYQDNANATILYDYWLAKYPITYAQYKVFLDDPNGYRNKDWWQGLHSDGLKQQKQGACDQKPQTENHPVKCVTWYDAMAFCAWFKARFKLHEDLKRQGYTFRLPAEKEWAKAIRAFNAGNAAVGGNATKTDQTVAVGISPHAVSAGGDWDMFGNGYNWTPDAYSGQAASIGQPISRYLVCGAFASSLNGDYYFAITRDTHIGIRLVVSKPVPDN